MDWNLELKKKNLPLSRFSQVICHIDEKLTNTYGFKILWQLVKVFLMKVTQRNKIQEDMYILCVYMYMYNVYKCIYTYICVYIYIYIYISHLRNFHVNNICIWFSNTEKLLHSYLQKYFWMFAKSQLDISSEENDTPNCKRNNSNTLQKPALWNIISYDSSVINMKKDIKYWITPGNLPSESGFQKTVAVL
jgi:hypothetical protein